jgi:hypothetical protein
MSKKHAVHNFVLVLSGVSEPNDRLEDALFEAGCDDALLSFRNQTAYLEFDRSAKTLREAILSAIKDVEAAQLGVSVIHIEPGDPVNAAEIARRSGLTREYIRLLSQGMRSPNKFPTPSSGISSHMLTWSYAEVANWLFENRKIKDKRVVEMAGLIRDVNTALEARHREGWLPRCADLLKEIERVRA